MNNFWTQLNKPLSVLAPMADVTDVAFRRVIAKYGKPDVMWTEFVSADGLYATRERAGKPDDENPLMHDLAFDDSERPIVAQLFTSNPETMEYAAALCRELGFDGIDINMGCPDRSIEKQGAGAAHIKDPETARAVIRAAKRGAKDIPVSVKTRAGYTQNDIATWVPELLAEEPAVLTMHLRTRKEMSKVPAHYDWMPEVASLRDMHTPETLVLLNGDIQTIEHGHTVAKETGADGAMLGRAIFGNPWCFNPEVQREDIALHERMAVMLEHTRLYEELLPHKPFHIMRKHYKAYVDGFTGAAQIRDRLFQTENAKEVEQVLLDEGLLTQ